MNLKDKLKNGLLLNGFERRVVFLVFVLIAYSFVASLPQTMMALSGMAKVKIAQTGNALEAEGGLLFRIMREVLLLIIMGYMFFHLIIARRYKTISFNVFIFALAVLSWILTVAWVSIIIYKLPVMVIIIGIRTFQYAVIAFIGYFLARNSSGAVLIKFANLLRWYVTPMAFLGAAQVLFRIGPSNETFFGIRAFGPFPNYNLFGTTMVACGLTFLLAGLIHKEMVGKSNYKLWFIVCCFMTIFSGSRGAILISVICFSYLMYIRFNIHLKPAMIAVAPLFAIAIFIMASSQAISGRAESGLEEGTSRTERWQHIINNNVDGVHKVFFGWGLGLSAVAVTTVYGENVFKGQVQPHSTYLAIFGNYGIIGLAIFCWLLLKSFSITPKRYARLFFTVLVLIMVPYNIWEFYPANVLLMFLWGIVTGMGSSLKDGNKDSTVHPYRYRNGSLPAISS